MHIIEKIIYLSISIGAEFIALLAASSSSIDIGSWSQVIILVAGALIAYGVFMATTRTTLKTLKETVAELNKTQKNQQEVIVLNKQNLELMKQVVESNEESKRIRIDNEIEKAKREKERFEEILKENRKDIDKLKDKINA